MRFSNIFKDLKNKGERLIRAGDNKYRRSTWAPHVRTGNDSRWDWCSYVNKMTHFEEDDRRFEIDSNDVIS